MLRLASVLKWCTTVLIGIGLGGVLSRLFAVGGTLMGVPNGPLTKATMTFTSYAVWTIPVGIACAFGWYYAQKRAKRGGADQKTS